MGTSTDGRDDYRHEWVMQDFMVEIDPYSATSVPKKRTGLGRLAHENGAFDLPVVGKPLAVYVGCDAQNEYVYKWVSTAVWDAADATRTDRMAVGDKYLDAGKLYVARFNEDGTGQWIELNFANAAIAGAAFGFSSQVEIYVHTRVAADAVGGTRMDRPEWVDVYPTSGEVYVTMTNNSSRRVTPTGTQTKVDAANPRAYTHVRAAQVTQSGNVNGHILRFKSDAPEATAFTWDVYLFGSEAAADPLLVNLSGLNNDQDFSSPDGLVFTKSTGLCWTATTLKRFYVGPFDCEVTGLCETPDGKTIFVNIQHPAEDTLAANLADPMRYTSQWPSNEGYGAGKRPRSATVIITKNDNGLVGFG